MGTHIITYIQLRQQATTLGALLRVPRATAAAAVSGQAPSWPIALAAHALGWQPRIPRVRVDRLRVPRATTAAAVSGQKSSWPIALAALALGWQPRIPLKPSIR